MRILNLCPHPVRLVGDGEATTLPAGPWPLRLPETRTIVGQTHGVPLIVGRMLRAQDVPPSEPGTLYLVSNLVRVAHPERFDFISPASIIRERDGAIVGCRALACHPFLSEVIRQCGF